MIVQKSIEAKLQTQLDKTLMILRNLLDSLMEGGNERN